MAKKKTIAVLPRLPGAATPSHYDVVLRTRDDKITAHFQDRLLYPRAVAWNRLLISDQGRESSSSAARHVWRESALQAIIDLTASGGVTQAETERFIASAAKCGEVQIELDWKVEEVGWAARVFPWEALFALATKPARVKLGGEDKGIVVGRWLRGLASRPRSGTKSIGFAASAGVNGRYDVDTEYAAIAAAVAPLPVTQVSASSLSQLREQLTLAKPHVVHYISTLAREAEASGAGTERTTLEEIAKALTATRPQLVALSSCQTGRRLAPLAIVNGAQLAVGFHDDVEDTSCPVFFGAFYREWVKSGRILAAVRAGIEAHNWKKSPSSLGAVTIWSTTDLFLQPVRSAKTPAGHLKTADTPTASKIRLEKPEQIREALKVTCTLHDALNYSMLHNKRGGLFARFAVLKLQPGRLDDLEVMVKIDTGLDRPVECHFFSAMPDEPDRTVDFMENITVPLGSELLRRRGEMLRGTVEVEIRCGTLRVFHKFGSIELPPCDEWNDDSDGRCFLPSFIFPRDPAVREILTCAQPFLRALKDDVRAAFDGYQSVPTEGEISSTPESIVAQLRAIWGAVQQNCRLDYTNPPPSYTKNVQRVRTPEEIVRARRATCLELALLLASCWEHIGLHPVIFLTKGHAFTGYWTSVQARQDFFDTKKHVDAAKDISPAAEGVKDRILDVIDPAKASGGGAGTRDADWLLRATHHLALISREIKSGHLVAVEATSVARLQSFGESLRDGRNQLTDAFAMGTFDGMLDVRTARDQRVTPLAIITEGVVA